MFAFLKGRKILMLEEILDRLDEFDDRLDKIEKKVSSPEETKELKADLRQYHEFMQQLVIGMTNGALEKAKKPTAAEIYAANKNGAVNVANNNTKSPKELNREARKLPLPG